MSETQITPDNPQFTEVLTRLFHKLFKAAGVSMISVDGHEQIRTIAQKLTETIEYHAEWKAIDTSKIFQDSVKNGFNSMEQDLLDQKNKTEQEFLSQKNKTKQEFLSQKNKLDNLEQAFLTIEKEIRQKSLDQKLKLDNLEQEFLDQKRELEKIKIKLQNHQNNPYNTTTLR